MDAGADPNMKGKDRDERTPLIAAVECRLAYKCAGIVDQLLAKGADVHGRGDAEGPSCCCRLPVHNPYRIHRMILSN